MIHIHYNMYHKYIMNSISDAIKTGQYNIKTVYNSSLYGIPFMTVGLIGITSFVLAYVTIVENNDTAESTLESAPTSSFIPQMPQMPQMPNLGITNPFSSSNEQPIQIAKGGKSRRSKSKIRKSNTRKH